MSSSTPRAFLARSTLINMGVRIAVVILLATLCSYLHLLHTLRVEALAHMQNHVLERGQREQSIFVLAEDNHAVLKKALAEKLQAYRHEDVSARFDSLFQRMPDGTVRSRPEGFDGTKMPGVFVPRGVPMDAGLRFRILASYDVLTQYGPAFHPRFTDTYVTLPEGAFLIYWPENPTWCQDIAADYALLSETFFLISHPDHNPERRTAWSAILFDPVVKASLVAVSTPLDLDGRHVATFSHDVLLDELMARTVNDHLPGAYNVLFRDDGQLIAHPDLRTQSATDPYNILSNATQPGVATRLLGSEEKAAHLRAIYERVKRREPGEVILDLPEYGEYMAVTQLQGPGWNLAMVLPERTLSQPAFLAARYVLLFGVLSLLLELAVMYWVLQRQLTRPLMGFTQATEQVAAGDFNVRLATGRGDELGRLARSFQQMADELQRREEALRYANTGLEKRVEERTQEFQAKNEELGRAMKQLRDTQKRLVVQEKLASLGSLTAGIAHELKNPLHFVNNFAELSSGLADEMAEHLGSQRPRLDSAVSAKLDEGLAELQRNLSKVLEHGNRANQIINGMLLHSRTSAGPREPADLHAVLKEGLLLGSHGSRAKAPGFELNLQMDCDPQVSQVEMVGPEILRVIINVVDNACYSMRQKKQERGALFSPRLDVRTRDLGERVEVRLRDNGTGIPSSLVGRVFEPFLTTKPAGEGTGLGLSISHDIIVGSHQGDLRLESVEGEFTELIIELPKRAPRG
jgi:two-component system NtrC family sensor kinase